MKTELFLQITAMAVTFGCAVRLRAQGLSKMRMLPVSQRQPMTTRKSMNRRMPFHLLLVTLTFFGAAQAFSQSTGDFRSKATGNWNSTNTWERWNSSAWVTPTTTPTSTDGAITIQNTHTVTVTADVSVDQVT